jgi:hypothetical protein
MTEDKNINEIFIHDEILVVALPFKLLKLGYNRMPYAPIEGLLPFELSADDPLESVNHFGMELSSECIWVERPSKAFCLTTLTFRQSSIDSSPFFFFRSAISKK